MSDKYAALRPKRPRHCYRQDRVPKKRYKTRAKAENAAARTEGYDAYRCPDCEFWHVGSKPCPPSLRSSPEPAASISSTGRHSDAAPKHSSGPHKTSSATRTSTTSYPSSWTHDRWRARFLSLRDRTRRTR